MKITILVASHKEYPVPNDSIYLPIQVGKELASLSLPFPGDNTGENISAKNPHYCELTALYWAWKNLDADYIGLAHYRRHFSIRKPGLFCKDKFPFILNSTEVDSLLNCYSVILPKPRNYLIETNYSHYIHAHPAESMDKTREIMQRLYPDYLPAFDIVMNRTKAHMFNMFIMKKEVFHSYCDWLFHVLFTLEAELDISSYDAYNQRIFGFVSELLLDVYLEKNKISYNEIDFMFMENEHWIKKSINFLKRKFLQK